MKLDEIACIDEVVAKLKSGESYTNIAKFIKEQQEMIHMSDIGLIGAVRRFSLKKQIRGGVPADLFLKIDTLIDEVRLLTELIRYKVLDS